MKILTLASILIFSLSAQSWARTKKICSEERINLGGGAVFTRINDIDQSFKNICLRDATAEELIYYGALFDHDIKRIRHETMAPIDIFKNMTNIQYVKYDSPDCSARVFGGEGSGSGMTVEGEYILEDEDIDEELVDPSIDKSFGGEGSGAGKAILDLKKLRAECQ